MNRRSKAMVLGISLLCIPLAAEAQQAKVEWVYTNGWARNHIQIGVPADEWIKRIEEATEGRVSIRHVSDGTLLKPEAALEGISRGVAECGAIQPAFTPGLLPISSTLVGLLDVELGNKLDLEGITRIAHKLYDEFDEISGEFQAMGVTPLVWTPASPYAIISKRPTKSLDDVQGQKIRAFGTTLPKFIAAMGATPVAMAFGEMYTSVQTGVIDAGLTDPPSMISTRLYEIAKSVLTTGPNWGTSLALPTILHVCRNDALDALSEEDREAVLRISREMSLGWNHEMMTQATAETYKKLEENGVVIMHLSDEETARLAEATPFFDEAAKELDDKGLPGTAIFARYRELAEKYLAGELSE